MLVYQLMESFWLSEFGILAGERTNLFKQLFSVFVMYRVSLSHGRLMVRSGAAMMVHFQTWEVVFRLWFVHEL